MTLELVTVPCLKDNYAYLLHNTESGKTAIVDFPESEPLLRALDERGWKPSDAFITHHHADHNDGLAAVRERFPKMRVIGGKADRYRLPSLDLAVQGGETVRSVGADWQVIDVPGHTVGHLAYYVPDAGVVFTADSLMTLGCGRLFEGTPEQMWSSLSKLMKLPADTICATGHEYTQTNARFALTIEPGNKDLVARAAEIDKLRAEGKPTVPSTLSVELATNPFLRAHLPEVKLAVGMPDKDDVAVFAEIRGRKDKF